MEQEPKPKKMFISNPDVKAFVQNFADKEEKKVTEEPYYKLGHSNHEIWRNCKPCDEHWDATKELSGVFCPKCGMPGDVG